MVVAQRILRHKDPRLTANVYSQVDLGDLRAGINRMAIPDMGRLSPGFVAPLSPVADDLKGKAPESLDFSNNSGAFHQSGRQDLNLRPLGPEPSALPG